MLRKRRTAAAAGGLRPLLSRSAGGFVTVAVGEIEALLRSALDATHVAVEDESRLHAGHGATGGHYRAVVVSERFAGLSRVAAQRLVYAALGAWMDGPIHAFAVRTFTPEQWRAAVSR